MLNLISQKGRLAFGSMYVAVLALLIGLVLAPLPVNAQTVVDPEPDNTYGWCTAVSAGVENCYKSPGAACVQQFNVFGSPMGSTGPAYATPTLIWYQAQCHWQKGNSAPFPSSVYFKCAPNATRIFPGLCLTFNYIHLTKKKQCGSKPNPWSPNPINFLTGAKQFSDVDFKSADGTLALRRTFVSHPFGNLPDSSVLAYNQAYGNWSSEFNLEVQIADAWSSNSIVTLLNGDGTAQNFKRQSSGVMAPLVDSQHLSPDTTTRLQFVGTWPTNLSTLTAASTQWQVVDADNNTWLLQTYLDPNTSKYDIAHPIQEKRPDGTVLAFAYGANGGLSTVTDQNGKAMTFTWNDASIIDGNNVAHQTAAAIASVLLPGGYKVNYTYDDPTGSTVGTVSYRLKKVEYLDSAGVVQDSKSYGYDSTILPYFVTTISDKNGVVRWKASYDTQGRAITSQGPNGEFAVNVTYAEGSTSATRTVTDALGRQTVYNYYHPSTSWDSELTSTQGLATTHCPASAVSNTYGADYFVASSTDEEGRVTKYTWNSWGEPTQIVQGYGTAEAKTTGFTWSTTFDLPTQKVETGLTTNYVYDTQGRITSVSQVDTTSQSVPYSTNGQTRTWTWTWGTSGNSLGRIVNIDGPLAGTGDSTAFTYNANGYLATVTNAVGKVTTISAWDWRGAPLTVTDPNSVQTTFTYDIHGRVLTATVNPGTSQEQFGFSYDAAGNVTQVTLPTGGYLQYTYDTASRLTLVKNDKGETITYTPNAVGQTTQSTTKTSGGTITQQQTMVYDELGRLIQTIGAASTTATNMTYDKVNNLKTIVDGRSKTTINSFDALSRVTQVANPENQTVKYGYNASNVVTSHKDGRNLETTFVTNGFGNVIREVSPDRGTRTYWYDLAGRMTKLVDGDGEETDFAFDNANRLQTKTFPGAAGEAVTYTYDSVASGNKGNGRLTSVTEQSGSSSFTYDVFGRVTTDKKIIQGLTYNVGYAYDKNNRITQITMPSGRVVSITRDNDGLITAVTTKPTSTGTVSNVATSVAYQPFGPLKSLTYGNGLTLTKSYNTNNWLTRIQVQNGTTAVFDLGYQYYDDGRLGEIDDNAATGRTVFMSLTDSGRLSYASGPWGQESYSWDAAGNRTGDYLTVGATTTSDNEITAGNSNRLVQTQDNNAVVKRNLSYRTGGDLYQDATVSGTTYTYAYNARKRLVQITAGSTVAATYGYDFLEHRIWRSVTGATPIHYIFDQGGHLIAEHNGNTGAVIREYIWIDDMPVAVIDKSSGTAVTYYIHTGHLNEPQVMTNASKAKVWDAYVAPFGKAKVFTTATANVDIRLPGQWYEAEAAGSGLNQNGYRDYDPSLGRYIEADPLGLGAGQNPYAYVDGRPYDYADPSGRCIEDFCIGETMLAMAAIDAATQYFTNDGCINWTHAVNAGIVGGMLGLEGRVLFEAIGSLRFAGELGLAAEAGELGTSAESLGLGADAAPEGVPGDSLAYEFRYLDRHVEGSATAEKMLAKGEAVHVFGSKAAASDVADAIIERGQFTGNRGGFDRYGLSFDTPIGYRIAPDGTRIPLSYGQLKVRSDGLYHAIPRTGPGS